MTARHTSIHGVVGIGLVALLVVTMLVSAMWTPRNPLSIDLDHRFLAPDASHLLGTDQFGRDVLSRIMVGARISGLLALVTVLCTIAVGTTLGTLAGYLRGPVETVVMTVNDALIAFPGLLLALALIAVLGEGALGIVIALTLAYTPTTVRVVRASVLSVSAQDYVEASRVMGNGALVTMWRHVVPNAVPQVLVLATSMFGWVLLSESALGFLGVGIPAPTPTWGNMLAGARPYLDTDAWLGIVPGLCIIGAVLGMTLLGDVLRLRLDGRA